jgi:SAM-dependent methyltransferase
MKRKNGKIISVDPFPTNSDVIESKGEDFLKKYESAFDCIILKFCLHFFENFEEFYKDLSKALKPNGKIFVLSLSPNTKLPWGDNIEKGFMKSCKNYDKKFIDHIAE